MCGCIIVGCLEMTYQHNDNVICYLHGNKVRRLRSHSHYQFIETRRRKTWQSNQFCIQKPERIEQWFARNEAQWERGGDNKRVECKNKVANSLTLKELSAVIELRFKAKKCNDSRNAHGIQLIQINATKPHSYASSLRSLSLIHQIWIDRHTKKQRLFS